MTTKLLTFLFGLTCFSLQCMHLENLNGPLPPVPQYVGAQELIYGLEDKTSRGVKPFYKQRVKRWLRRGANINCCSPDGLYTPLSRAISMRDHNRCNMLLELGADVNGAEAYYTPLAVLVVTASFLEGREIFLSEQNFDIDKPSERSGVTLLMVAAYYKKDEWTEFLLRHGADPLAADFSGNNALFWEIAGRGGYDRAGKVVLFLMHQSLEDSSRLSSSRFITFLCCLKRIKKTGDAHDRAIADSMYQNRMKIWRELQPPDSFQDIVAHRNNQGKTGFDYYLERTGERTPVAWLLNPEKMPLKERIKRYEGSGYYGRGL